MSRLQEPNDENKISEKKKSTDYASYQSNPANAASRVVFEGPVKSGLLAKIGLTGTLTGLPKFTRLEKPDRTDRDRLQSVFCG